MREKLAPFVPAILCGFLGLITIVGNIAVMLLTKTNRPGVDVAYYCFLPICFYLVGIMLTEVRRENRELREQLNTLTERATPNKAA